MKQKQKTFLQRKEDVKREWHLVDVKGKTLGRIATEIAIKLMGKHKPTYTPHTDGGDYVVVLNAREVKVTANKAETKRYYSHSGFPGGLRSRSLTEMLEKHPEEVLRKAVINMLPKNRLRKNRMVRLKIYVGSEHPHQSHFGEK